MNYKYTKKPVEIEAFQMTRARGWDQGEWPSWLIEAWRLGVLHNAPGDPSPKRLVISTLEGDHNVSWSDYIIRGIKGELYPCKPDIFVATYDEAIET